jgi:tetrapyrrole methylase family protein / MazG family protein
VITVVGLGPGDLDRVPRWTREALLDPEMTVIVRTLRHPAANDLADLRAVVSCDDIYEAGHTFEDVYDAIADRVISAAAVGDVIYAVPGSPRFGEFSVRRLEERANGVEVLPAESFVDAVLAVMQYDPFDRGLQILNGHHLPDPLVLDKPTIIGHLDRPEVLADVVAAMSRVIPEESEIHVIVDAGGPEQQVRPFPAGEVDASLAGLRTSIFVDSEPGGLIGAVRTMRRLREECPWDRDQTHQSLVKNLVEEAFELADAIASLPEDEIDHGAYAAVEDEVGDLLLQVLFHSAIARQVSAFDVDDAAETLRQKLVRRHPHVFGDADAGSPDEVKKRWDEIKAEERGGEPDSALDGVPAGMPGLYRASKIQNKAAKVGFDWPDSDGVLDKLREEIAELEAAIAGEGDVEAELGDVLFSVVNLARHLDVDSELSLQRTIRRFEERFRRMEAEGPFDGLTLEELDERWERAK